MIRFIDLLNIVCKITAFWLYVRNDYNIKKGSLRSLSGLIEETPCQFRSILVDDIDHSG